MATSAAYSSTDNSTLILALSGRKTIKVSPPRRWVFLGFRQRLGAKSLIIFRPVEIGVHRSPGYDPGLVPTPTSAELCATRHPGEVRLRDRVDRASLHVQGRDRAGRNRPRPSYVTRENGGPRGVDDRAWRIVQLKRMFRLIRPWMSVGSSIGSLGRPRHTEQHRRQDRVRVELGVMVFTPKALPVTGRDRRVNSRGWPNVAKDGNIDTVFRL